MLKGGLRQGMNRPKEANNDVFWRRALPIVATCFVQLEGAGKERHFICGLKKSTTALPHASHLTSLWVNKQTQCCQLFTERSQNSSIPEHGLTTLIHYSGSSLRRRFCGNSLFAEAAMRPRGAGRHTFYSGHKPSTITCLGLDSVRLNACARTDIYVV
jgi:hypothetical protein